MSKAPCGMSEEKIVDYVLNRSHVQDAVVDVHLKHCQHCARLVQEWRRTLGGEANLEFPPFYHDPPKRMHRRIMRAVRWRLALRSLSSNVRIKHTSVLACLLLCLIAFSAGFISLWDKNNKVEPQVATVPSEAIQFIADPETSRYVATGNNKLVDVDGELWLNGHTGDVLLIVRGVGTQQSRDYQVWMVRQGSNDSMGLLQVTEQVGFLFARVVQIDELEHIVVSMEPKGGSLSPTGPEAIRIGITQ